jgi:hypothetical protein
LYIRKANLLHFARAALTIFPLPRLAAKLLPPNMLLDFDEASEYVATWSFDSRVNSQVLSGIENALVLSRKMATILPA